MDVVVEDNNRAMYCTICGVYLMDAKDNAQYMIGSKLLICHACAEDMKEVHSDTLTRDERRRRMNVVLKGSAYRRVYARGFHAGFELAKKMIMPLESIDQATQMIEDKRIGIDKYWSIACSSCSNNTKQDRSHLCNKCRMRKGRFPTAWIGVATTTLKARATR